LSADRDFQIQPDRSILIKRTEEVGIQGEAIAAQWILSHGWKLLHHRWRCRWGEIDLVAQPPGQSACSEASSHASSFQTFGSAPQGTLVFIEVKTRRSKNWDANGLLAITPEKQQKLWQTAELFLSLFPEYTTLPCRFDLVLIQHRRSPKRRVQPTPTLSHPSNDDFLVLPFIQQSSNQTQHLSQWITLGHTDFRVQQHIQHAIEL
jgi:putative endonuclease